MKQVYVTPEFEIIDFKIDAILMDSGEMPPEEFP